MSTGSASVKNYCARIIVHVVRVYAPESNSVAGTLTDVDVDVVEPDSDMEPDEDEVFMSSCNLRRWAPPVSVMHFVSVCLTPHRYCSASCSCGNEGHSDACIGQLLPRPGYAVPVTCLICEPVANRYGDALSATLCSRKLCSCVFPLSLSDAIPDYTYM